MVDKSFSQKLKNISYSYALENLESSYRKISSKKSMALSGEQKCMWEGEEGEGETNIYSPMIILARCTFVQNMKTLS